MAKLWIYGSDLPKRIEQIDDGPLLAALAAMDGETAIDLSTGQYAARLEHIVPRSKMLSSHLVTKEGLREDAAFKEYMRRMPRWAKLRDQAEIESLGTRHMKALRITYAYPHVLAVTVSSDGPLRLWKLGYVVEQWMT